MTLSPQGTCFALGFLFSSFPDHSRFAVSPRVCGFPFVTPHVAFARIGLSALGEALYWHICENWDKDL
eukprot:12929214-Prorocentrum_lima.AAC.1